MVLYIYRWLNLLKFLRNLSQSALMRGAWVSMDAQSHPDCKKGTSSIIRVLYSFVWPKKILKSPFMRLCDFHENLKLWSSRFWNYFELYVHLEFPIILHFQAQLHFPLYSSFKPTSEFRTKNYSQLSLQHFQFWFLTSFKIISTLKSVYFSTIIPN